MRLSKLYFRFTRTKLGRLLIYRRYDSDQIWKDRSSSPGQTGVLWTNETYNECFRKVELTYLAEFVKNGKDLEVLDVGCGVGVVSKFLAEQTTVGHVDAIDFGEMISEAQKRNPHEKITYINSSAENYQTSKKYDLIVSSASFVCIRDTDRMLYAIRSCAKLLKDTGSLVMIEPFHSWRYLARAKISAERVSSWMELFGYVRKYYTGFLYWPYRERLANSTLPRDELINAFADGEWKLQMRGWKLWSDYKILVFERGYYEDKN